VLMSAFDPKRTFGAARLRQYAQVSCAACLCGCRDTNRRCSVLGEHRVAGPWLPLTRVHERELRDEWVG